MSNAVSDRLRLDRVDTAFPRRSVTSPSVCVTVHLSHWPNRDPAVTIRLVGRQSIHSNLRMPTRTGRCRAFCTRDWLPRLRSTLGEIGCPGTEPTAGARGRLSSCRRPPAVSSCRPDPPTRMIGSRWCCPLPVVSVRNHPVGPVAAVSGPMPVLRQHAPPGPPLARVTAWTAVAGIEMAGTLRHRPSLHTV
jgi:hypothetical protein